jgi:hypothetical protein
MTMAHRDARLHQARPISVRHRCNDWPLMSRLSIVDGRRSASTKGRIYDRTGSSVSAAAVIARLTTGRSPYTCP